MPLPPGTMKLKIHPAIGFARLSANEETIPAEHTPSSYKSEGLITRRSVRFRIFAYGGGNTALEELTPQRLAELGIHAVWHATVANRKISTQRNQGYTTAATARSDTSDGNLVGQCGDFQEGQQIPLGQILADGTFVPPVAGVFRDDSTREIPNYASLRVDWVADNTSDGPVGVELFDLSGNPIDVPVHGAWVVIAPPDFAPDWDDDPSQPPGNSSLLDALKRLLELPDHSPVTPLNATARAIDREVLARGTGAFAPGIEVNAPHRTMFEAAEESEDPDDVRVKQKVAPDGPGAAPGDLTVSLCSPWQFDFIACTCSFWPNHRPDVAFKDSPTGPSVKWDRRVAADSSPNPEDNIRTIPGYIDHVYELGIIRKESGKRIETERNNDITS